MPGIIRLSQRVPLAQAARVSFLLLILTAALSPTALATSYYFSSSASCPGSGTSGAPYCALTSANSIDFNPGDQMLLNRGSLWTGQRIDLSDSDDGSSVSWVTMDAYGSGARPILDWTKLSGQKLLNAINIDYWNIKNLEVREAHIGMEFNYTTLGHQGLHLENIYFHDMFIAPTLYGGAALYVSANGPQPSGTNFYIKDVWFVSLEAKNTAYAPGLSFFDEACPSDACDQGDPIQNVVLKNNYFHDVEGATSVQDVAILTMIDNQFANFATVAQPQGTTNLFFWHTSDANTSNNVFDRIPDTSSADQSHIDLEGFVSNADFRGNYFTDAAGNAIEFLVWHTDGSYLTGIDIDGNVFNRNSWDTDATFNGAIGLIKISCAVVPSGTISNSLYYEPDGLFVTNGCSHSLTLTSNTDVGSSASFAIAGKDFSSVQGTGNWRYRYSTDTGSTWTDMGYYNAGYDNTLDDRWQINSSTAEPYATAFQTKSGTATSSAVARQWTAPSAGTVNIRSRVLKYETGGDGVHVRITKNGANLWPASGWQLVGASDQVGVAANLSSVSVASGDLIRFELKNNANNTSDRTSWLPMITFVASGGGGCAGVCWEFATDGNLEGWSPDYQSTATVSSGSLHVTATGVDAQILNTCFVCGTGLGMSPSNRYIHLRLQNDTSSTTAEIYFITDADQTWDGVKTKSFTIQANSPYTTYVVDMGTVAAWTGTIRKLRVDPGEPSVVNGLYHFEFIRALPTDGGGCAGVCWEFSTNGNLEGWSPDYQSTATVSSGSLHVTATGVDAQVYNTCHACGTGLGMSPSNRYIHLRLQNDTSSTTAEILFITDADQTWDGTKWKSFTIQANSPYTTYVVDMGTVTGWTGTIRKLRVDPGEPSVVNGLYHYDYIKALPTP